MPRGVQLVPLDAHEFVVSCAGAVRDVVGAALGTRHCSEVGAGHGAVGTCGGHVVAKGPGDAFGGTITATSPQMRADCRRCAVPSGRQTGFANNLARFGVAGTISSLRERDRHRTLH